MKPYRYHLEYYALCFGAWIIQCLPWRWLRPIGRAMGGLFFLLDRHRRQVALANIKSAFGDEYDAKACLHIAQKSYEVFAASILELLWSPRLSPEIMDEIATIEVVDPISSPEQSGVAVIYCCLHAANFEWTGQIAARHTERFPVIAQKFKNPLLGKLFNDWRSSLGQEVLPQEQAMLKLFRYLKTKGKFGILVDLNLKPDEGPVIVRAFNRLLVPLTRLPAELALRTGALLVPVECLIRPEGGYTIRFHSPVPMTSNSSVESLTQAYWDVLESGIRRHPEYWLWSYKHWRYRPSSEKRNCYPFYANCFDQFDLLLEQQQKKCCEEKNHH
ncbi:MAG: lysophospholipid acyltransferase family protein [Verrucomicrobiae bacterium]|nr:lysophospholipid acyltransferase family protein [Verrucomicrobiae bacterium]